MVGLLAWALAAALTLVASLAAFPLLLRYGILRTQLFDIDLRTKWGLRRGAVAGAIALVFPKPLGKSARVDAVLAGLVVAPALAGGALVFALAPLQRFADALSQDEREATQGGGR